MSGEGAAVGDALELRWLALEERRVAVEERRVAVEELREARLAASVTDRAHGALSDDDALIAAFDHARGAPVEPDTWERVDPAWRDAGAQLLDAIHGDEAPLACVDRLVRREGAAGALQIYGVAAPHGASSVERAPRPTPPPETG